MGLFGKEQKKTPNEMVREWTSKIRREGYNIDRQIQGIKKEEEKVKRSMKDYAKKGEKDACKVLAKEIINSRKAVRKLYASKAQMNSIQMQMKNQLALAKMSGSLEKSTEVMKSMQQLVRVPEIQATMRELSKEMTKAGIMEEMLEDTMDLVMEEDEEDVDAEVEKVLLELTEGQLEKAPPVVSDTIPSVEPEPIGATAAVEEEEDEDEMKDMQARLQMLRS